jgi:hypothetical protein
MLHRVDGVLVLYRRAVKAAVLPYRVVITTDRWVLRVGNRISSVIAAETAEGLDSFRRRISCPLPTIH